MSVGPSAVRRCAGPGSVLFFFFGLEVEARVLDPRLVDGRQRMARKEAATARSSRREKSQSSSWPSWR